MPGVQQEVLPRGPCGGGAQRERGRPRGAGVLLALLPPRLPHPLPEVAAFQRSVGIGPCIKLDVDPI